MDSSARDLFANEVASLLRAGQMQTALDILAFRLQSLPEEAEWRLVMAILQQRAGRPGEAAATLAALRTTRPDDPAMKAMSLRLADDDAGRERRRRAAEQLVDEAREAVDEGEREAAIARGRAAVEMAPEAAEPHRFLAELLAETEPHAAQRAADYAACLSVLERDQPDESDQETSPGRWREAWRLSMAEWPGWLMLDSLALLVIVLPLCVVLAYPVALWLGARSGGGTELAWQTLSQSLVLVEVGGCLAWAWMVLASCCYGAQRLLVMTGRMSHGRLRVGLLGLGFRRFLQRWAGLTIGYGTATLVATVLTLSVILFPVALLALPLLLFTPLLIILDDELTGRAAVRSAAAIRRDWLPWVVSSATVGLSSKILGVLSLIFPAWGIVMALRQPSLTVALLWLVGGLVAHTVLFPIAWAIAHVGSFAALLAYRDTFGDDAFSAVSVAMADDEDDEASDDLAGPADVGPAGDELGDAVADDPDDGDDAGT